MVSSDVWGPALWRAIHLIALGYPSRPTLEQQQSYLQFFTLIGSVIPCSRCRRHYMEHLATEPVSGYLKSQEDLFAWTVLIHNLVNVELGKPLVSVPDALQMHLNDQLHPSLHTHSINSLSLRTQGNQTQLLTITSIVLVVIAICVALVVAFLLLSKLLGFRHAT